MFAGVSLFATVIVSRPSGAISRVLEMGHLCVHNQVFAACTGQEGSGPQKTPLGLLSFSELNKVKIF